MKNNCIFCIRKKLEILKETPNFLIIAEKFPIIKGTLLLIPKKHFLCYGLLSRNYFVELNSIKEKINIFFKQKFPGSRQVYMEHGVEGQTIFHAHLHCIPSDRMFLRMIKKDFIKYKKIGSMQDLGPVYNEWKGYFFYQENKDLYVFKAKDLQPGYLRFLIAGLCDSKEKADWKKLPDFFFEKDIKFLKDQWSDFKYGQ